VVLEVVLEVVPEVVEEVILVEDVVLQEVRIFLMSLGGRNSTFSGTKTTF
jgi:hypothetical protein